MEKELASFNRGVSTVTKKEDNNRQETLIKDLQLLQNNNISNADAPKQQVAVTPLNEADIPHLADGGIVEGPESGYQAILHGKERVEPEKPEKKKGVKLNSPDIGPTFGGVNEFTGYNMGPMTTDLKAISQIASKLGAFDKDSQTITDPEVWKKVLNSGIGMNYDMGVTTVGTQMAPEGIGNDIGDRIKELMETNKSDLQTALDTVKTEFQTAMSQVVQQLIESKVNQSAPADQRLQEVMLQKFDTMIDHLSSSNDKQEQLIKNSMN